MKKSSISNYIPHKTPKYINYNLWYKNYYPHLVNLYSITIQILNSRYENTKELLKEESFKKFCILIFNSSSKYIPKF